MKRSIALATAAALLGAAATAQAAPDPLTAPIANSRTAEWMRPQPPQRIYGDSYYVGLAGLSSVLIKTRAGLILIDASLPQSAAMIEAHVRELGFRLGDIKYILITEAHYDHAGGAAAIARDSGATVVASPATARALRAGRVGPDDPQYAWIAPMPPVARVQEIRDGESLELGGVRVTARQVPIHTAGSTSWTWPSCEGGKCLTMVFAASLNPVAADGYRFLDHPERLPVMRAAYERFAALPCDVMVSAHPDNSGADAKLKSLAASRSPNPFIDPGACRAYAAKYRAVFDERLAKERASTH